MEKSSMTKHTTSAEVEVGKKVSKLSKPVIRRAKSIVPLKIQLREAIKTVRALQKRLRNQKRRSRIRRDRKANTQDDQSLQEKLDGDSSNPSVSKHEDLPVENAEAGPSNAEIFNESQPRTPDGVTRRDGNIEQPADEVQLRLDRTEQVDTNATGPLCELAPAEEGTYEIDEVAEPEASEREEPTLYKCPYCLLIYANPDLLIIHLPIHDEKDAENADDDDVADEPAPLISSESGREARFQCSICRRKLSAKLALEVHMRLHTGEKPYQCKFCDNEFRHLANFQTHMKKCARKPKDDGRERKAKKRVRFSLNKSIGKPARKEKDGLSAEILKEKSTRKQLTSPMQANKALKTPRKVACSVCRKPISYRNLQRHMQIHTGERRYPCPSCNQRFRQLIHLQRHMQVIHLMNQSDVKEETEFMGRSAKSSKKTEKLPQTESTPQRQLPPCKVVLTRCDNLILAQKSKDRLQSKGERRKAGMDAMERISILQNDNDEDYTTLRKTSRPSRPTRPYSPSSASNSQSRSESVDSFRARTEGKSFKCSKCLKSFSPMESLISHLRLHMGNQDYKCLQCNKAFDRKKDLRMHMTRHAGKKLKCQYCPKNFSSLTRRSSHVIKQHLSGTTCVQSE